MTGAYARAGVDIDAKNISNRLIGQIARTTYRPEVLSEVGFFSGMYEFKGYRRPVLVSSTDSVGTKVKLAIALGRYDTVGMDIVNHCVNDIFTCGASPIFFLDYIGIGKLIPERAAAIVKGSGQGLPRGRLRPHRRRDGRDGRCLCRRGLRPGRLHRRGGGEGRNHHRASDIAAGDAVLGLPSSGLHTNGYSLARKIFGDSRAALQKRYAGAGPAHRRGAPGAAPLLLQPAEAAAAAGQGHGAHHRRRLQR